MEKPSKQFYLFSGCYSDHVIFVSKKNEILSHGLNESGNLSIGDQQNRSTPTPLQFKKNFKFQRVIKVSMSMNHTLLLLNKSGVSDNQKNYVFSVGSNLNGELSLGDFEKRVVAEEVTLLNSERIIDVIAGGEFSVFLCENRKNIFCSGDNTVCQLGCGDQKNRKESAAMITSGFGDSLIRTVTAGGTFCTILCENGKVFQTGVMYRSLVINENFQLSTIPVQIRGFNCSIKHICAGGEHLLALGFNGKLFGLGRDGKKQLCDIGDQIIPNEISEVNKLNLKIKDIKCGYENSVVLTHSNKVFYFGDNKYSQSGYTSTNIYSTPVFLQIDNVVQVELSALATFLFTKNGELKICGRNGNGELGQGHTNNITSFITSNNSGNIKEVAEYEDFLVSGVNLICSNCDVLKVSKLEIKFENMESVVLDSCFFVQSEFLKREFFEKKKKNLMVESKYFFAVMKIKKWLKGKLPIINDVDVLTNTYILSKEWKLSQLCWYLIEYIEKYEIKEVIDLIFTLEDSNESDSAIFLKCFHILKLNFSLVMNKLMDYIINEKQNENNKSLVISIIQLQNTELSKVIKNDDLKNVNFNYNREYEFKKHVFSLLTNEETKDLCFKSIDGFFIKVHKKIMTKSEYFKVMLTSEFSESKLSLVDLNISAKCLIPIVVYIYTEKVELNNLEFNDILLLSKFADKYLLKELQNILDKEITSNSVGKFNSDLSNENVKLRMLCMDLKFENNNLRKKVDNLQLENTSLKNENTSLKNENISLKNENTSLKEESRKRIYSEAFEDNEEEDEETVKKPQKKKRKKN